MNPNTMDLSMIHLCHIESAGQQECHYAEGHGGLSNVHSVESGYVDTQVPQTK